MTWSAPDPRQLPGSTGPVPPPAQRRWPLDVLTALMTAAFTVLLAAPAGLIWSAVAPHAHVQIDAAGANVVDGATEVFIAGDGWFLGVTLLAGIVCGITAWLLARRSAPYVLVALVAGGFLAAWIASRVGMRIGRDELEAAVASGRSGRYVANVSLQMREVFVVWPLAALMSFVALVLSRIDEVE